MKQKRIICLILTVATLLGILPTTALAACSHRYERIYTIENERMHSYESECTRCGEINNSYGYAGWENHDRDSWGECIDCGHCDHSRAVTEYYYENDNKHSFETECENCGKSLTGGSYSGWEDHNFWRDECEDCGYTRECTHDDSETVYEYYTVTKHETASYCFDCGITYNTVRESHDWEYTDWESISEYEHERTYYCPLCEFEDTETDGHDFYRGYCESCGEEESSSGGYKEEASVSLSATGPSGTLGSAGGEITAESLPASYTVKATATGCTVEKIVYILDGKRQTEWDDTVTITVNSEDEFESTNFTVYTDADVSATFTVNFKYVRKKPPTICGVLRMRQPSAT